MHLQPIRYRGRLAAAATPDRFILSEHVELGPPGDLAMVTFMCVYAREIALSRLPGPYTDPDARRFARACLLTPGLGELLERPDLDLRRAASALNIPPDELRTEYSERVNQRPRNAC